MLTDIRSTWDCQALVSRILQTLAPKGYNTRNIPQTPKPFPTDDNGVLEQLSEAILSIQAKWASIKSILPALRGDLFNYDMNRVARLPDRYILASFEKYKREIRFRKKLFAIRDNAKVFIQIADVHGSVCSFIRNYLPATAYDSFRDCYIRPADADLLRYFTYPESDFRLHQVQLAICCEFFKNIGIDEFKPDAHTITFLNRINIDRTKAKVSRNPIDIREIGITVAQTLPQPRAFVDSLMWCLCAEEYGEICTENDPKCHLCKLKDPPQLCAGYPGRKQIAADPLKAATRFKECNLTRREAYEKMVNAGLSHQVTDAIVTKVYGPRRIPKVKWEDIETFIKANPSEAAKAMKQAGLSYNYAYKYMIKAGLPSDEVERILSKVYSNSEQ